MTPRSAPNHFGKETNPLTDCLEGLSFVGTTNLVRGGNRDQSVPTYLLVPHKTESRDTHTKKSEK